MSGVQVNVGGLQTLQAGLAAVTDVLWTAIDYLLPILECDAKFGGNRVPLSVALDSLSCGQQHCMFTRFGARQSLCAISKLHNAAPISVSFMWGLHI